ncbi:hypothetical protein D3C84_675230 [compost metagenome]
MGELGHRLIAQRILHRRASQNTQRATDEVHQQFGPDGIANLCRYFNFQAPVAQHGGQCIQPLVCFAIRAPQDQPVARVFHLNHPRGRDRTSGVGYRAHSPIRPNRTPQRGAWVDPWQLSSVQRPAAAVEIPPGNAIHGE